MNLISKNIKANPLYRMENNKRQLKKDIVDNRERIR